MLCTLGELKGRHIFILTCCAKFNPTEKILYKETKALLFKTVVIGINELTENAKFA